jgi:DNA-binding GntR family transcriptional regulator
MSITDAISITVEAQEASGAESLHEKLVSQLRDIIVEGEIEPGARISERLLCERFGVSRTPLREVLKVLASEGLIDLLPNRGARVARLEDRDVEDMFEVMAALEALSGRLACARISEPALADIRALHYRMLAHYLRRQLPEYFRLNQAIHEAIVDAAENPVLKATYLGLSGRIRRARYFANMSDERWAAAVAEHEEILAALSERDGEKLARILDTHLKNKSIVVRGCLQLAADAV